MPVVLDAFEALPLPEPPRVRPPRPAPGQDQLAWHLSLRSGRLEVDVRACHEATRGWREGERIPLKALPEPGQPQWDALGGRERQALQALQAWHRQPESPPLALLSALEGHSRLSGSPSPGQSLRRIALERRLSVLQVQASPQGWRLSLSVRPGPGAIHLQPAEDVLSFTGFLPLHRELERLLGPACVVPHEQTDRLVRLLARWSPHLPLWTDLEPIPRPPDSTDPIHLSIWIRGGRERLDMVPFVRPAPGFPRATPGQGPRLALAGTPRQGYRRNLEAEQATLERIQDLLQVPGTPEGWRIQGQNALRTALAHLRDLDPPVHLEGVPGWMPEIPRRPTLHLASRPVRQGLELSGTLDGIPIQDLQTALKTATRFLERPDGGLLDLLDLPHLGRCAAWGKATPTGLCLPPQMQAALLDPGMLAQPPARLPEGFKGTLRPYQHEGFQWMARLLAAGLGACLADDMGLGKTVQTAALLAHRADLGPALVVAPTSVAFNWEQELARFTPRLRIQAQPEGAGPGTVVITSYGYLARPDIAETAWATVVLDEAHAIKNPDTLRARSARSLRASARLALTGTPVENHPDELIALMGWLLPDLEVRFRAAPDAGALKLLASPFLLRRLKAEVLPELPPRTDLTVRVELGEEEQAFHHRLREDCRQEILAGGMMNLLAALMKLRRACAHPTLADPACTAPGAKLDLLCDRLATLIEEGHRCLVFSQFTDLLDLLGKRLKQADQPYVRLDGSMSPRQRAQAVEAFQSGRAPLFLLSLRAGGTGLNLTQADDVFHVDPWWNPAVEDQASDRAHRMGRTRPVTIHRLVAAGTIEERVLALHQQKRAMVESLLEGQDQAASLDRETLLALLD